MFIVVFACVLLIVMTTAVHYEILGRGNEVMVDWSASYAGDFVQ